MRRFRYKVNLNYNPKNIKKLKQTVIPKQIEIETSSDIFIKPKLKHILNNSVMISA